VAALVRSTTIGSSAPFESGRYRGLGLRKSRPEELTTEGDNQIDFRNALFTYAYSTHFSGVPRHADDV